MMLFSSFFCTFAAAQKAGPLAQLVRAADS
jgi:hypothetical protein